MRMITHTVHKHVQWSLSGRCQFCGKSYGELKKTSTSAAAHGHRAKTDHLPEMAVGRTIGMHKRLLTTMFINPGSFGVLKPCPHCHKYQSWMNLYRDQRGSGTILKNGYLMFYWLVGLCASPFFGFFWAYFLFSLIAYAAISLSRNSFTKCPERPWQVPFYSGPVPISPALNVTTPHRWSFKNYPPHISPNLDDSVTACLFCCDSKNVPELFIRYLGAETLKKGAYRLNRKEKEDYLKSFDYLSFFKRGAIKEQRKFDRDIIFAVSVRAKLENWINLAILVEDYKNRFVSHESIMKLVLAPEEGGIYDEQLVDLEYVEKYFGVDRRKKDYVRCPDCEHRFEVPVDSLPLEVTCPKCGVVRSCNYEKMRDSFASFLRLS